MPVRATESRIPDGFTANDLGQSAVSGTNASVILISFLSSPVAVRRIQNYVVFVTDRALAPNINSYDWSFTEGNVTNRTTSIGLAEYTPQNIGTLTTQVNLKNGAGTVLASVSLMQQVVALNPVLEERIDERERNFPGAAHPDTSREMLNDLRLYVNSLLPTPANNLYNKTICSLAYARALQTPAWRRNIFIEDFATILNSNHARFYSATKAGFGICKTRPQLLAMFLVNPATPGLNYINPPIEQAARANVRQRSANERAIQTAFDALTPENKIDLFNLLRFPKSHFTMAQQIFDGLEARYFPNERIAQTLAVGAKAKQIITEYETGLVAFAAAGRLRTTPFSRQVFSLINNGIWTIPIPALAGGAAAGGAPVPGVPAPVGAPEKFPEITFIAHASPNDNGFIRGANVYHESYALNPQTAFSFEGLLHTLGTANTPIVRLRIVSHFALAARAPSSQIFIPFFTDHRDTSGNPIRFTNWWYFKYGISDEEGLNAYFEHESLPGVSAGFLSNGGANAQDAMHRRVFRALQAIHDASLAPFQLQNRGNPNGSVLTLIMWCSDLFASHHRTLRARGVNPTVPERVLPPRVLQTIRTFITGKIDAMKRNNGAFRAANVDALRVAITGLTLGDLGLASAGSITFTLSGAFLEQHDALRADLTIVKNRLNNGFVDIRGCRIGQDRNYMRALREFFGNAGIAPIVSGPNWFQSFPVLGFLEPETEAQIDQAFSAGGRGLRITGRDVQREYSDWSGRIGINSQLSFWTNLFRGDKFTFLTLSWKNQLPPIGMDAVKLQGLSALGYPELMTRLKEIFFIPAATGPSPADLNTFNTTGMPRVNTLQTIQEDVSRLNSSSPQASLEAQRTSLTALATALNEALPPPPSPLTIIYLQACIDQLKAVLVAQSAITPLLNSLGAKCAHTNAGIRYLMAIGLPLILQSAAREGQIILMYLNPLQEDALKSYMKISWEGPLPAAMLNAINSLNPVGDPQTDNQGIPRNDSAKAFQSSLLAVDHQDTRTAINPTVEFHEHIITEP